MFLEKRNRKVLPRWRDFQTTLALGELENGRHRCAVSEEDQTALTRRAMEWQDSKTVWHAGDLLSSAYVLGNAHNFRDAAQFILDNKLAAPTPLIALAKSIVHSSSPLPRESDDLEQASTGSLIRSVRQRLRDEPRNTIQWVELSRLYRLSGDADRAVRAMIVAMKLGPDSRFVVRCAARLFLHAREPGRALRALRNAAGAKTDPWIIAAEIAVASASDSPSLFAKLGKSRNEDDGLSLFERAELSSSLATLELENGKHRQARQLFRRSMESPNENSVAQVEWANRQIGGLELSCSEFTEIPRSFEANAQLNFVNGNWSLAIQEGVNWLNDQPFSKGPAIFTSYVSSLTENYRKSVALLRASLKANPGDFTLINNLGFALASDNQIQDAITVLRGIDIHNLTGTSAVTLAATSGLVMFRQGFSDQGRRLYKLAVEKARALKEHNYRLMADLYLAREELLAHTPVAREQAAFALKAADSSLDKAVLLVASQVRELANDALYTPI